MDPKALNEYGMPDMTEEEKEDGAAGARKTLMMVTIVPRIIGLLIAYAIYYFGSTAKYDSKIATLSGNDLGWLFLGAFSLSKTVLWLNFFPMYYKSQIMRGNSGNLRANLFIYKVNFPAKEHDTLPYVVMEDEGEIGEYNRANRSLHHFTESAAIVVMDFLLAGYVFPFPVMVLMMILCLGRVFHQIGYAGGYGGHGIGFGLSTLSLVIAEMLVLLAAFGGLGFDLTPF